MTEAMGERPSSLNEARPQKSYGRRKSRPMSARKERLLHLFWQAVHHPEVGFIGCEPFINGVASLLGTIEDHALKTVRIHDGDARDVLVRLPGGSIARVFLLFPDPWPKKRQVKRRLLASDLIAELARIMAHGAELRFASDSGDYAAQALLMVTEGGAFTWLGERAMDWTQRPPDWPETRYERKALAEGRKPVYLSFKRL
jgi:tRNA (guanine-N7-)-methyltransferase